MKGVLIAITVIIAWATHLLAILVFVPVNFASPLTWFHILLQAYLFTGLFITAHDAMHATVSRNRTVNRVIGTLACFLFAGLSYKRLIKNHVDHHRYPGTEADPDYSVKSQNFFVWLFLFMVRYTTILQLIIMAVTFNILILAFPEKSVITFWVVPSLLGTAQLFYFGTYLPHRMPHTEEMKPHNSRSMKMNHLLAMVSCYFFGYHTEHHESPGTPWWQLYKLKEQKNQTDGKATP